MNLESASLLLNSFLTIGIGAIILYNLRLKKLKTHNFYYFWAIGFILYGIQIAIREIEHQPTFYGTVLVITAFSLFLGGIWSLNRTKPLMALTFSLYAISLIMSFLYFSNVIEFSDSFVIGTFMSFFPVTIAILYHRSIFGSTVDKLALGWILLCISNILIWDNQLTLNLLAFVFKIVILFGILDYDFLIIGQKVLARSQHLPTYTSFDGEGGFKLVTLNGSGSKNQVIDWLIKETNQNIANGSVTYIFSFQDIIPYKDLWRIKWLDPKKVSILLFSSSAETIKDEFEVLPMDLAHIGAATTEIVKDCKKIKRNCSIFFLDLSVLIHFFGADSIYKMLLSKMGSLREGKVQMLGVFHPNTHKDDTVFSLFKNISDEAKEE